VSISILVPTRGRPGRLPGVLANITENTRSEHEVIFVVEGDDVPARNAVVALAAGAGHVAGWAANRRARSYAGAINTGFQRARGDYVFAGADDLRFQAGWDTAALALMRDPVRVVGTNDLLNTDVQRGTHATHYLVDRRYIAEVGGVPAAPPGLVLFEGYDHNFTDTEFIAVARARGVFAPCLDSVVEHLHFYARKADWDDTYAKGSAREEQDRALFHAREQLWTR
jgi:glycosyltransferase involved in cell wall biosynthesis